jgi:fumarate hydratase subunit alpha
LKISIVVRYVEFEKVVETVKSLCIAAAYELPDDVLSALTKAAGKESNPRAAKTLNQLIENARIAAKERIPLCQDTGLAVVFVEQGEEVAVRPPRNTRSRSKLCEGSGGGPVRRSVWRMTEAINAGVADGYEKGYLRKSVVGDPLNKRKNTGSNTPAVIHYALVPGDKLKITIMAKGGGCENKSRFKMFNPTAQVSEIIDWVVDVAREAGADACPPFIVGVGIGGDFEVSCFLSKRALLRNLNDKNPDKFYAKLEKDLLTRINALGLGPQGLGGDTTALAVLVEVAPCHIASLPVAVNIECHSHRHKTAII